MFADLGYVVMFCSLYVMEPLYNGVNYEIVVDVMVCCDL